MPPPSPVNLPNLITSLRLVMAGLLFVILALVENQVLANGSLWLNVGLAIFVIAGLTDVLDGYLARKWELVTAFGRIVDPFADKVIVCGTFVFLIPIAGSHVAPWVVVTVLARELLVDGLRGSTVKKSVALITSRCVLRNSAHVVFIVEPGFRNSRFFFGFHAAPLFFVQGRQSVRGHWFFSLLSVA